MKRFYVYKICLSVQLNSKIKAQTIYGIKKGAPSLPQFSDKKEKKKTIKHYHSAQTHVIYLKLPLVISQAPVY